jgi:hypothetical protein
LVSPSAASPLDAPPSTLALVAESPQLASDKAKMGNHATQRRERQSGSKAAPRDRICAPQPENRQHLSHNSKR